MLPCYAFFLGPAFRFFGVVDVAAQASGGARRGGGRTETSELRTDVRFSFFSSLNVRTKELVFIRWRSPNYLLVCLSRSVQGTLEHLFRCMHTIATEIETSTMTVMTSSLRNRLLLCAFLLKTILIRIPVSSAEEVTVRDSSQFVLRRRTIDTVVITDGKVQAADADGVRVADVFIPTDAAVVTSEKTERRMLRKKSSEISDSLERSHYLHEETGRTVAKIETTLSAHRRTQDIEDILEGMATKDPSEWSAVEWIVMILFLSFLGWLGCCLLTICCCGGCDTSNLLGWLCCWEIFCRGGSDIDRCCDYALT
jgi:hypothetical protein